MTGKDIQRFGAPGSPGTGPGRPRTKIEETTDLIDTIALEFGPQMFTMAVQTLMDGMRSGDLKLRVDSAKAALNTFHHPSKQIDMNVNEQVSISAETREAVDQLTAEERAIVEAFESRLLGLRQEVIVDAEVIEEVQTQIPPPPPPGTAPHE